MITITDIKYYIQNRFWVIIVFSAMNFVCPLLVVWFLFVFLFFCFFFVLFSDLHSCEIQSWVLVEKLQSFEHLGNFWATFMGHSFGSVPENYIYPINFFMFYKAVKFLNIENSWQHWIKKNTYTSQTLRSIGRKTVRSFLILDLCSRMSM